ncbi:hypothetical protein [Heyndrickxia oleronia]|uniref:hypothetical protein n=1 Tax=Heyndrickxia oleronia TaxID=38875 RepID=UPI001C0EE034|nr:hypothetical protein [Heyndrickxia oleronia]MBU5213892.1 hypothetical protein [Heyndrickxia oleronia]
MKKRNQKALGYYMQGIMLPCMRDLKKLLGKQDAAIQTNEILLRHFEEIASKQEKDINIFLKSLADKYKISHGSNDFNYVRLKISESNIVNTFTIFDAFLKEFATQLKVYKNISKEDWKDKDRNGDQLDTLNQIIENISVESKKRIIHLPEYHLLEYYRFTRNSIIHTHDSQRKKERLDNYNKEIINKYETHFIEHYKSVPSLKDYLNFEDYFLYTRAIKYFSNVLNDAVELSYSEVCSYALNDENLIRKLRGTEGISEQGIRARRIKQLKSYFFNKHGYSNSKKQQEEFLQAFKEVDKVKWDKY